MLARLEEPIQAANNLDPHARDNAKLIAARLAYILAVASLYQLKDGRTVTFIEAKALEKP